MGRTGRVSIAGPLAVFADGFRGDLERLGYSPLTAEDQLRPILVLATFSPTIMQEGHRVGQPQHGNTFGRRCSEMPLYLAYWLIANKYPHDDRPTGRPTPGTVPGPAAKSDTAGRGTNHLSRRAGSGCPPGAQG